jgi:Domain of unknown function (DUF3427)
MHPEGVSEGGRADRLLAMLHFTLWGPSESLADLANALRRIHDDDARREELIQVLNLLGDRLVRVTRSVDPGGVRPLQVHAHYRLAEALAAFGMANPASMRQWVFYSESERADAFFVTLRKTERHYSPTTLYQDYAISPRLFHWESQSTTTSVRPPDSGTSIMSVWALASTCSSARPRKPMDCSGRPPISMPGRCGT